MFIVLDQFSVVNPISGGETSVLWTRQTGLTLDLAGPAPQARATIETLITDEAALSASADQDLRVTMLVKDDQLVAQGAPILELRHQPGIVFTAPMAGRIAAIDLAPGRRLSEVRLFREDAAGRHEHATTHAQASDAALRELLLQSGLWRAFRSRPFGGLPNPDTVPSAIFVAGLDTRPLAPDPALAVRDREEHIARGVAQLLRLTNGPVFLCQEMTGADLFADAARKDRIRDLRVPAIHPWGLPGFLAHRHQPATITRPVWDIHVEDVAAIGALLATGLGPETRLISVAGPATTEARLVRCQPGADLRGLCRGRVVHGPHIVQTGSPLDARPARWLGARDRQVTVIHGAPPARPRHWLIAALRRGARPHPIIPTAAADRALGGAMPTMALLRALAVGDRETAIRLGALSLVGEDLALADYLTCAEPRHSTLLEKILHDIAEEEAP
ncbi:Na+-transporting NADH:ubiquinone oxidoreductase subunit A [Jannaschia faecimaris]|uniref:Na+-transporting NADH:ubiquinone oxidoreductase subunit A n=1 Tax=Jannaschia faecimaris TaxID=1244108 RepID=A0A1H3SAI1_9RHOB|nr:hypothetical protein [Jannaschia faecimaris]SDZ34680.1 Na+-transporting NADH:ubiquinone oxidoreductase subunit A [Jannaschia faecimaris]